MIYFRYCKRCGTKFTPESKYQEYCFNCLKDTKDVNFIKMICSKRGIDINKIKNLI